MTYSPRLARRRLLQATLAGSAVAATAGPVVAGATAASAADGVAAPGAAGIATGGARFVIGVLPDTQYLFDADSADPEPLRATLEHVRAMRGRVRGEDPLVFLAHLGDVTEHGTEDEIALASQTFARLDGAVPWSVLAGNHDVPGSSDDQRGDTPYLRAFGPQRFAGAGTWRGASPDGYSSAHVVQGAGREWLVLALDWRLSAGGFAWARTVLADHPTLPAIVTTHELAAAGDDGVARLSDYGQRLWDGLVRDHDQVFLTLNGHFWPPGRTVLTNAAGHDVHVHVTNYQDRYYGGAGMVRLYTFDLARKVVDVETVSPWLLQRRADDRSPLGAESLELTSDVDRFSFALDPDVRFAAFAPPPAPAPRPAGEVMPRGTAAYWRFDAEGLPGSGAVADGTVVRDLTGRGNDLVARRIGQGAPGVTARSEDHHVLAPAHASLRFDGGTGPDRGGVLEAVPDAPINAETFTGGYTIELFAKLPDPFEGDHAWMGLLSWTGRSGDAGKTTGWSPLEPTCSLNLSPERFLQYVVYPAVQDADPTSWSHALPVGRWMHLAVVNDTRTTVVYVDGSRIARNPTQPSTGIATLGKPLVIGATSFDEQFGQGFYGWIGDVRICTRPLRAREFLAPVDDRG